MLTIEILKKIKEPYQKKKKKDKRKREKKKRCGCMKEITHMEMKCIHYHGGKAMPAGKLKALQIMKDPSHKDTCDPREIQLAGQLKSAYFYEIKLFLVKIL